MSGASKDGVLTTFVGFFQSRTTVLLSISLVLSLSLQTCATSAQRLSRIPQTCCPTISMADKMPSTMHIEDFASNTSSLPTDEKAPQLKVNLKGLVLVPQPSNDPRDPLVRYQTTLQQSWN